MTSPWGGTTGESELKVKSNSNRKQSTLTIYRLFRRMSNENQSILSAITSSYMQDFENFTLKVDLDST